MTKTELMPTREVAQRLNVDTRTVHRMVQSGRLEPAFITPGYRGDHLFDPADVDALAEDRRAS